MIAEMEQQARFDPRRLAWVLVYVGIVVGVVGAVGYSRARDEATMCRITDPSCDTGTPMWVTVAFIAAAIAVVLGGLFLAAFRTAADD